MEEKHVVIKSDYFFMDRHGHMKPDLKVSVKTEPQKWMLESKPKIGDGTPWEAGDPSREEKCEEVIVPDKVKIDTPTEPEDQAASDDMDIDNLTEFKCFDAADQNNNGKRVNTDDHPVNKKAKCELIEDMLEEEMAVSSAFHEEQDNVAPEWAIESEGDARRVVSLPTEAEEPRTNQHSLKGKMCQVCGLVLASKGQKKKHQAAHPLGVKMSHCVSCGTWFQYIAQMEHHKCRPKLIGNLEKPHKCNICGGGFAEVGELTAHQQSKHRQKCLVCGLLFVTKREKQEHQATHTLGEKRHQCGVCNKWFEYLPEFETHTLLHNHFKNQEKQTMCAFCGVQFSEMEDLIVHLSSHPKLMCCICGVRLMTKTEKKEHKASHIAGEKTHHCILCNKWFEYLHGIEHHTLLKHPNSTGGPHNCTRCCSRFTVIEDLNAHMDTHRKKCHVCGLTFDTKGEKKIHHAEHPPGEKTHHCTECDMWFVTLKQVEIHTLQKHMDSLTKPHKCNVCEKAFLYADALSDHKGKH